MIGNSASTEENKMWKLFWIWMAIQVPLGIWVGHFCSFSNEPRPRKLRARQQVECGGAQSVSPRNQSGHATQCPPSPVA
jgi:hypothetical protein